MHSTPCSMCVYSWFIRFKVYSNMHSIPCSMCVYSWFISGHRRPQQAHWRKVKQMQPMRLCILYFKQFEETFESAQCRKVKQMHPMWLYLFSVKPFEDTFENSQWRKAKQMQPMWLCFFSGSKINTPKISKIPIPTFQHIAYIGSFVFHNLFYGVHIECRILKYCTVSLKMSSFESVFGPK